MATQQMGKMEIEGLQTLFAVGKTLWLKTETSKAHEIVQLDDDFMLVNEDGEEALWPYVNVDPALIFVVEPAFPVAEPNAPDAKGGRAFFEQVIKVTVLSENEPLRYDDLADVHEAINSGAHVGKVEDVSCTSISASDCAQALMDAGSEPGFFQLGEQGEDLSCE